MPRTTERLIQLLETVNPTGVTTMTASRANPAELCKEAADRSPSLRTSRHPKKVARQATPFSTRHMRGLQKRAGGH
jgi:hypothetical protein